MTLLTIGYGQVVAIAIFLLIVIPLLLLIRAIIRWLNRH